MDVKTILKEHSQKTSNGDSLGIVSTIFADHTLIPTVKNLNKRVSLLFTDDDGDSIRANASKAVNAMYRNGQITLKDMLGMNLYMVTTNEKGEPLTNDQGEPLTLFVIGTNGGQSVGKVNTLGAKTYVPKPINLDDLA